MNSNQTRRLTKGVDLIKQLTEILMWQKCHINILISWLNLWKTYENIEDIKWKICQKLMKIDPDMISRSSKTYGNFLGTSG